MDMDQRALAAGFDIEKLMGEFYADPYPTYRALRENEPVKRMPNGSYFLTRYDDLVTAYKNTKAFSSDKRREFAPKYGNSLLYDHHTTSLVFNDPPAHTRVRRLIMGALSPRAIAGMEPDLIALVDGLLDAIAAAGADVIELGVPFSDPMADGPVIQRASERALAQHVGLRDVLAVVEEATLDEA